MAANGIGRIAVRLHWTEGQVYTGVIGTAVAVVLAVSGLPATLRDRPASAAPATSISAPTSPPTTDPSAPSTIVPPAQDLLFPGTGASPGTLPFDPSNPFAPIDTTTTTPTPPPGGDSGAPPAAPASTCTAGPLLGATRTVLDTLHTLTGILPNTNTQALLANISGCGPGDPTYLVLGILSELGKDLPATGFTIPFPALDQLDIPSPIVTLVQPLRPLIDPACSTVSQVTSLMLLTLGTYPIGIGSATLAILGQVLGACAQLRPDLK